MDSLLSQMKKNIATDTFKNIDADVIQQPRRGGGFKRNNKPLMEKSSASTEKENSNKKQKDKCFGKTPSLKKQLKSLNGQPKPVEQKPITEICAPEKGTKQTKKQKIDIPNKREDSNAVYFNPRLTEIIRNECRERKITVEALKTENQLPFIFLLKNPLKSYSPAFGSPCTFLITGYLNNKRTERVIVSPVETPTVVSETKNETIELSNIFSHISEKLKNKQLPFSFSVILSADETAQIDKDAKIIPINEPFSVDGIFGGTFLIDNKPQIFIRNPLPITIRKNYPYFKQILNREVTEENAGAFYRRCTRNMSARERSIFKKELNAFANICCSDMQDMLYVSGIISLFTEC